METQTTTRTPRRSSGPAFLSEPTDVDLVVARLLDAADSDEAAIKAGTASRSATAGVRKLRKLADQLAPYGTDDALAGVEVPPAPFRAAVAPEPQAHAS